MKYGKMEWGKMEAVINKLGGMRGVADFLSCRSGVVSIAPWEKITVGLKKTPQELRDALDALPNGNSRGSEVVKEDIVLGPEKTVELVLTTLTNIGLSGDPCVEEIYARAAELYLGYCPDDTAAEVLLQCGENLNTNNQDWQFAMDPKAHDGGGYRIRQTDHSPTPRLVAYKNMPGYRRHESSSFVFTLK